MEEADVEEVGGEEILVPLSAGFVPYVISWESELQPGTTLESVFLVVMLRTGGLLDTSSFRCHQRFRVGNGCRSSTTRFTVGPFVHRDGTGGHADRFWPRSFPRRGWGPGCRFRRSSSTAIAPKLRQCRGLWLLPGAFRHLPAARGVAGASVGMVAGPALEQFRRLSLGGHSRQRPATPPSAKGEGKSRHSRFWYRARKSAKSSQTKETYHGIIGSVIGGSARVPPSAHYSDSGADGKAGEPREASGSLWVGASATCSAFGLFNGNLKAVIYDRSFCSSQEPSKNLSCGPAYLVSYAGVPSSSCQRSGGREIGLSGHGHGTGDDGSVSCVEYLGGHSCQQPWGSYKRSVTGGWLIGERLSGKSKTSTRAGRSSRDFLLGSCEINGTPNEPYPADCRDAASADGSAGDLRCEVPGTFWWLWETSRAWADSIPTHADVRLYDEREPPGRPGHSCTHNSDAGAGSSRQWEIRDSSSPLYDGRPSSCYVHKPSGGIDEGKGICAISRTAMDHSDSRISQGARCHIDKADGAHPLWRDDGIRFKPRRTKAQSKAKEERERKRAGPGGGELEPLRDLGALALLEMEIGFAQWALALPRFIFATRCRLAWQLRRSFSVCWHGATVPTTVFPLPVPYPGCFDGGGPHLSRARLLKLGQKRLVHIMVLILNKLYLGRFASVEELGRSPNTTQLDVFDRLYKYVAVSGSSLGSFKVPPGRSGPELVASLATLEAFLEKNEVFNGGYSKKARQAFEAPALDTKAFPQLMPYKSLDADRLKLTGTGSWPLASYLDSVLWLPYVEPRFLLHGLDEGAGPFPVFDYEKPEEYLKLARKWDSLGLLRLYDAPLLDGHFSRVFNAFKNKEVDRQIGDRRIPNARERCLPGPSAHLPPGYMLTALSLPRWTHSLRCSMTDRRDFYHQAAVTPMRARSNMVPFHFPLDTFENTRAFEVWKEECSVVKQADRAVVGDRLGFEGKNETGKATHLFPCFGALFQGDHLGVEFALDGHQNLLQEEGLLWSSRRLLHKSPIPLTSTWEALIIDDYFCISAQEKSVPKEQTEAFSSLSRSRVAYGHHELPGSIEKDVVAEDVFKAAGAEVISSPEAVERGLVTVGAPLEKRFGLAAISLRVAGLKAISTGLASRLSGSWVSVLMFRRCLSSLVSDFFSMGALSEKELKAEIMPLSRAVAEELVCLAAMAPLMCADATAPFLKSVFATDASMAKGAVVQTEVSEEVSKILWLGGDRRGGYTMLDNVFRAALKHLGEEHDIEDFEPLPCHPEKPFQLRFDFVEVFGGVGRISDELAAMGFVVAPVLDLSNSRAYDLSEIDMLRWMFHMLDDGAFASVFLCPPCTTFSPAAYPAVRSYSQPEGFDRKNPKVISGNCLAFRSLIIARYAKRRRRPNATEQPRRSKMAWLKQWKTMVAGEFKEAIVASCMFGSIHQKEFRFLLGDIEVEGLDVRCSRDHKHVKIEGRYTKQSAIYTVQLARHLAQAFARALRTLALEEDGITTVGKESVVVNDVLHCSKWWVVRCWSWRARSHINVLEVGAVCSLLKDSVGCRPDSRFSVLCDSQVAKCSLAKGRSSAHSLKPVLCRCAALQIAGGLQPAYGFAPTRFNTADAPTREKPLPERAQFSINDLLPAEVLQALHHRGFSRPFSGWIRLTILVSCVLGAPASPLPSQPSCSSPVDYVWTFDKLVAIWISWTSWILWTFVAASIAILGLSLLSVPLPCDVRGSNSIRPLVILVGFSLGSCAPMEPLTAAEAERANARAHHVLQPDRTVRPQTRENRQHLLGAFQQWVLEDGRVTWEELFEAKPPDPELISDTLVRYGQDLFGAGKPYQRFSETINAVASLRPIIKRQLTRPWDLCFAWLQDEPCRHHPALPSGVLLAMLSVALMWGWKEEAAIWAMAWAGIMRIGEALNALREDLILPAEGAPGTTYILLKIRLPKTRGRGPRHQAARIDQQDLVKLIVMCFEKSQPSQKLWPWSAATLRKRFNAVQQELGLPLKRSDGERPYELASLRAGGATWLLQFTELPELVRRRGRWAAYKSMELYLQEVVVTTGLSHVSAAVREKIAIMAESFPEVLEKAIFLTICQLPPRAWYFLYTAKGTG